MTTHALKYTPGGPMMHGPAVRRLQELLDGLHPDYDTGDNDGIYGPATAEAVRRFQHAAGLTVDGIAGRYTMAAAISAVPAFPRQPAVIDPDDPIVSIADLHPLPKNYAYNRPISTVRGVMWHQTGCEMPAAPEGWGRVNAHYGVTLEGVAILINHPRRMIWHGNKPSPQTVGIEIEGNHHGVLGDASTLWRGGGGPHYLNDAMIAAAHECVAHARGLGCPIEYQRAHRQSKAARRGDPGSAIWEQIARPLDLPDGGPEWRTRGGRVIPWQWDPEYMGEY